MHVIIGYFLHLQPPDYWAARYRSQGRRRGHGCCGAKRTKDLISKDHGKPVVGTIRVALHAGRTVMKYYYLTKTLQIKGRQEN